MSENANENHGYSSARHIYHSR